MKQIAEKEQRLVKEGSIGKIMTMIALSFTCLSTLSGQELSVVVEAGGNPSRDSHFNWSFESSGGGSVQMGQFACGSWWVAPAVGDTGVKVLSLQGNPEWTEYLSCDADPITENHGLMGIKVPLNAESIAKGKSAAGPYGSYDASENIIPNLPMTFTPASQSCISLVAAMQRNEEDTGPSGTDAILGEGVDSYCVVTVLPSAPANEGNDMIRPNITGATKRFLTWNDFDLSRIPSYSFIDGREDSSWERTAEVWRHSTEIFGMATEHSEWGTIRYSEGGRAYRSHILIQDYAAGMTASFNSSVLALFSTDTDLDSAAVKKAIAALLSFGLDIYHARYDYGTNKRKSWTSGAGQSGGQYLPVVLLGALLKDSSIADQVKLTAITNHGEDPMELGPQELRQYTRGVSGVLLWGDNTPFLREGNNMIQADWRYWADMKSSACYDTAVGGCNSNTGKKTAADPYGFTDGPANNPGSSYMSVSFGGVRSLAAAMILMPKIREVVNTDAPIEYVDRIHRHGLWTYPDPIAAPSVTDQNNGCTTWWSAKNCSDWGITWGAYLSDIRFGIEGGNGRFASKHGNPVGKGGYESSQAFNNWDTIIALYDGLTYEDNAVPLGTLPAPEIFIETGVSPRAHIRCPYPDAEIRYTLDGTDPSESSALYTEPVALNSGAIVKAKAYQAEATKAYRRTENPSAIREKSFYIDVTAPSVPTNLVLVSESETTVELSWDASTDDFELGGYEIYTDGEDPVIVFDSTGMVLGLSPDTAYEFSVSAFDKAGNKSALSVGLSVTTAKDLLPPSVPARLISTGKTASTVSLSWRDSGDNISVSGYRIYVNGVGNQQVSTAEGTVSGLLPQTAYSFTVSALDSSGNESAQSSSLLVTTEVGSVETWYGFIPDANGDVDTNGWIDWVNVKRRPWVWSYSLKGWVYGSGTGSLESGAWLYLSKD